MQSAQKGALAALDVALVVDDYLALTAGEDMDVAGDLEVEAFEDPHHHGSLLGRLAHGGEDV